MPTFAELEKQYEENPNIAVGQWKGYTTYKCKHCPFDSLEQRITEGHVFDIHLNPSTATRPITAALLDSNGKQIREMPSTVPVPIGQPVRKL